MKDMAINYFDPKKTTGSDGYINYKLSGGESSGGNRGSGSNGLGCGGLILIILLVFAFLNDIAGEISEGGLQLLLCIGLIIVIAAVVKFLKDN